MKCPVCNHGHNKHIRDENGRTTTYSYRKGLVPCKRCGGTGFIKKQKGKK